MTPDTMLGVLQGIAAEMALSHSRDRSRAGSKAYRLIGDLRIVMAGAVVARPKESISDAAVITAVKTTGSIKAAAIRLDCHPRTVARRVKLLIGQCMDDVQLQNAKSLRRSTAIRAKRMSNTK